MDNWKQYTSSLWFSFMILQDSMLGNCMFCRFMRWKNSMTQQIDLVSWSGRILCLGVPCTLHINHSLTVSLKKSLIRYFIQFIVRQPFIYNSPPHISSSIQQWISGIIRRWYLLSSLVFYYINASEIWPVRKLFCRQLVSLVSINTLMNISGAK